GRRAFARPRRSPPATRGGGRAGCPASRLCRLPDAFLLQSPAEAIRQGHDHERGVRGALGREHAAVADEQVGDLPRAELGVDDRVVGREPHAAAADEVRVAVDLEGVLRVSTVQDLLEVLVANAMLALSLSHSEYV